MYGDILHSYTNAHLTVLPGDTVAYLGTDGVERSGVVVGLSHAGWSLAGDVIVAVELDADNTYGHQIVTVRR